MCEEEQDEASNAGEELANAAPADKAAKAQAFATRCRDQLSTKADLRFYTTTDAVRDLDAVRQAIGAAKINLVGISYGTRVAQQYAMRHPATTRTIVLDSVAPNTLILGNDFARNLEQALDLQFGQCGKVPACAKALGDPRSRLDALMTRLRSDPPLVRYRDAATNQMREERLLPQHVAGLMRMYAYAPLASSLLPLQLKEASEGRYDGLMAMAKMLDSTLAGQMMFGMQLSVICSEDAYGLKDNPDDAATLLGNQFADYLGAQCKVWPQGRDAGRLPPGAALERAGLADERRIRSGDAAALRRRGRQVATQRHATWSCAARATTSSAPAACRSCSRSSSTRPTRSRSTRNAWRRCRTRRLSPPSTAGNPERHALATGQRT